MLDTSHPQKVLIFHENLPQFDRSGADFRIMQVLRCLRELGHEVTYFARSRMRQDIYEPPLRDMRIRVCYDDQYELGSLYSHEKSEEPPINRAIQSDTFDVVIFFTWFWNILSVTEQYLVRVRQLSPRSVVVVLTDDRHWLRQFRAASLSGRRTALAASESLLAREEECYRSADLVLTISDVDRKGLLEKIPELDVEVLPIAVEEIGESSAYRDFEERSGFLFLANWDNSANLDAAMWFCGAIWPVIASAIPDAELLLAGNGSEHLSKVIGSTTHVSVLGHVPDLKPVFDKVRVSVNPIRIGSGINTKIVLAMQYGVPVVSTLVGAEGIGLIDGITAAISDSAAAFAEKCIELYVNRGQWEQLASAGHNQILATCSRDHLKRKLSGILAHARELEPKRVDASLRFSIEMADDASPESLFGKLPAVYRRTLGLVNYIEYAHRLAEQERYSEACEQLSSVFVLFDSGQHPLLAAWICHAMQMCCTKSGNLSSAAEWGQEIGLALKQYQNNL